MENNLQIFEYNKSDVRVIEQDGEPWFVAKDVCGILELTTEITRRLDEDEKGLKKIQTLRGMQDMTVISESGLYALIMRSNKSEAKQFRKWVTGTVLPSIRKTGMYATPKTVEQILTDPDSFIKILQELKASRTKAAELETKIENNRPKVIFADAVDASEDSMLIGNFAKILKQILWFRENGWLINLRGERWNMPTQKSMERGFFEVKKSVINNPDGSTKINHTPKITGKGQIFFANGFLSGDFELQQ